MKFLNGLVFLLCSLFFISLGAFIVAFAFDAFQVSIITDAIEAAASNVQIKLALGAAGAILTLITVLVLQNSLGAIQREKTIAFENPDGQVLISLTAIEDFIKRAMKQLPEVKELRPSVRANKKGVSITSRVTLFSDTNLPETTGRIQNIVKERVQSLLGIEEPVNIRVHVAKIVNRESPALKDAKKDDAPAAYRGIEYSTD